MLNQGHSKENKELKGTKYIWIADAVSESIIDNSPEKKIVKINGWVRLNFQALQY